MKRRGAPSEIAKIIRKALGQGHVVDIEGLGAFRPVPDGFEFVPENRPRVFLAYAQEDLHQVEHLYRDLRDAGCQPWLDRQNLLPGQNWPRSVERAIDISDFFVACFSRRSVLKRGVFQSELRYALECATRLPLDEIFVIPVRLEECIMPDRIRSELHVVDVFPDWGRGVERIRQTIAHESARRRKIEMPRAG